MTAKWMRWGMPAIGLLLTAGLVFQVRAARQLDSPSAPAIHQNPNRVIAEGRLVARPGAATKLGTDLAGVVARVLVHEQEPVKRGQLLAELNTEEFRAQRAEAVARIAEAEADIALARAQVERSAALLGERVISKDEADRPRRDLDAALARKTSAESSVRRVDALIARARFIAPFDGVVTDRLVEPGEAVREGAPLVAIADLTRARIEAEVDEFDTPKVKIGSSVTITAEGFADREWAGVVEQIPDTVVSRRLKPLDPGQPTDARVLLVKIAIDEPAGLKLGQRVSVEFD